MDSRANQSAATLSTGQSTLAAMPIHYFEGAIREAAQVYRYIPAETSVDCQRFRSQKDSRAGKPAPAIPKMHSRSNSNIAASSVVQSKPVACSAGCRANTKNRSE